MNTKHLICVGVGGKHWPACAQQISEYGAVQIFPPNNYNWLHGEGGGLKIPQKCLRNNWTAPNWICF